MPGLGPITEQQSFPGSCFPFVGGERGLLRDSLEDQHRRYAAMTYPENRVRVEESIIPTVDSCRAVSGGRRCPASDADDVVREILIKIPTAMPRTPVVKAEQSIGWCWSRSAHGL
jgi:hypothetical protein